MVVIRKAARGGDGWGGGYYLVQSAEGEVVLNATMTSTASSDIIGYDSVCLGVGGMYNISLHGAGGRAGEQGGGQGVEDMGVTVQQCGVYLSEYATSALLEITAVDSCNPCSTSTDGSTDGSGSGGGFYSLDLVLVGSLYGIPYG